MKVTDVEARVQRIRETRGDPESAHLDEDGLHFDVLKEIARQGREPAGDADSPAALAEAAIKTEEIDFPRWYA